MGFNILLSIELVLLTFEMFYHHTNQVTITIKSNMAGVKEI